MPRRERIIRAVFAGNMPVYEGHRLLDADGLRGSFNVARTTYVGFDYEAQAWVEFDA